MFCGVGFGVGRVKHKANLFIGIYLSTFWYLENKISIRLQKKICTNSCVLMK